MAYFIATLHALVEADSEAAACDTIAESLRELCYDGTMIDWGYAKMKQPASDTVCGPVETALPEGYEEGDLYEHLPETHRFDR